MGAPRVEPLRDTIRHACGVTHEVSLTKPTATFHPDPLAGQAFMPLPASFVQFPLSKKGWGEAVFHIQPRRPL